MREARGRRRGEVADRPVLVTGFEPFGGAVTNPSAALAKAFDGRRIAGYGVVGAVLPCTFSGALPAMHTLVERLDPIVVIALGLAGGRAAIALERVAVNLVDASIPDNAGSRLVDVPVDPAGPTAHFATLPLRAIVTRLRGAGIPAELSMTAGTYVCNYVFYGLMQALARRDGARGGFIHVPHTPDEAATFATPMPSLDLELQDQAIEIAIATSLARLPTTT